MPSECQVNSEVARSQGSVTVEREPSSGSLIPHGLAIYRLVRNASGWKQEIELNIQDKVRGLGNIVNYTVNFFVGGRINI